MQIAVEKWHSCGLFVTVFVISLLQLGFCEIAGGGCGIGGISDWF